MDTIFALASARGRAGVSVVRISGSRALSALEAFGAAPPPPRRVALRRLRWHGEVIDGALVLRFAAGASFTGEDIVELHLHGSPAIVGSVTRALASMDGVRMAEPGEFTRRALESGRLDLAEVEGLAALIDAETEAQRRQAQRVFSGALGELTESWRHRLVRAAALIEATIDFADEDVPEDVTPEVKDLIGSVAADLRREIAGSHVAERIRDGFEVAIVGPPNIGKSTLLNRLAGRDAAITSSVAGTTRDVIEVRMDIAGLPVTLLDTAGLRETKDPVEALGVGRARERARNADLRVFLVDDLNSPDVAELEPGDIKLLGKGDLRGDAAGAVSGLTGSGVDALVGMVADVLGARAAGAGTATHTRHRIAMAAALVHLDAAEECLGPAEIAADELRQALNLLDQLVGRVDVEHLLDEIFRTFCLGK